MKCHARRDADILRALAERARASDDAREVLHDALLDAHDVPSTVAFFIRDPRSIAEEYATVLQNAQDLADRHAIAYNVWFQPLFLGQSGRSAFFIERQHTRKYTQAIVVSTVRSRRFAARDARRRQK